MTVALLAPRWLIPQWPVPLTVRALSTFRPGGFSRPPYSSLNLGDHVEDSPLAVTKNRRSLRESAGLPAEPSWLSQAHGVQVVNLDEPDCARSGDAAVTRQSGTVCAVLTADCLPVLLATEAGDRVAAVHAGWRGLAGGVIEATVTALNSAPRDMLAWLGPAIGPAHFEVGPEVRAEFLTKDPQSETAFVPNERGRYRADLYALARQRLARAGVGRVYGGGECTFAQADKYFSYRRDGRTGRQATLIWLQPRDSR